MKYINFKRYKFSTIFKNINFKFSTIFKNINFKFSTIFKNINFKKYNISKIYKYSDLLKYYLSKFYKYFDLRKYDFSKIYKYLNIKRYKYIPYYITIFIFLSFFVYLSIPFFYNYDESKFTNLICKDFKVKCFIKGEIKYSFFPSPRINLENLEIKHSTASTYSIGKFNKTVVKISLNNLHDKEKFQFTKVQLEKGVINLNYENIKKYKNIFNNKNNLIPIIIKKSKIKFFDKKNFITSIDDISFKYKSSKDTDVASLNGMFLDDKLKINFKNKKKEDNLFKTLIIKLSNLRVLTKIELTESLSAKNETSGNILFKINQNKITGTFDFKDNQIVIKQANLRNNFLDGKLNGVVKFLPFFTFNLDTNLNSINFNRLHSSLVALSDENKKNLFRINKKINGKLNLTAAKVFSKHTLVDSFESRIQFINGDIFFDQLLLNLKKLGAADVIGVIKNDKKFSNFAFENNIYLDNLKKFYNKFGIYNKEKVPFDLFISGNIDLANLNLRLNEISAEKKLKEEDVSYIEDEFNNLLLEDGYVSLFDYGKLKEFIKQIIIEIN